MKHWASVAVTFLVLTLVAPSAMAQDLLVSHEGERRPDSGLQSGHSAAHYGIAGVVAQRASLRAVLGAAGLDAIEQTPGLGSAVALSLVEMFAGGGGSPSDLARPRTDVKAVLSRD
ncbi:MAG: hypothetical protein PHP86_16095 [Nevskiales bacterium]|nr:hypothetical protein [Nevskiales bacterium]